MVKTLKMMIVIFLSFFLLVSCSNTEKVQESTETLKVADKGDNGDSKQEESKKNDFLKRMVRSKRTGLKKNKDATVTVLVYMNGSDLESESGEATTDLSEMIAATHSDKVNVVVQTMGTKKWNSKYSISSKHTQRYLVRDNGLELIDDSLGQLDCTVSKTLSDFIKWGAAKYPADRYILQLWDHGGGPVYGFGYDEWRDENDALTMDEMQTALKDGGVFFDFIGMDCCIMSSLEVCCALYDYCDYAILSEEFESGLGWSYKGWLTALAKKPTITTEALGKIIVDDMVSANQKSSFEGDSSTLAVLDESYMKLLYAAWVNFAYSNEEALLTTNYSQKVKKHGRVLPVIRHLKSYGRPCDYDECYEGYNGYEDNVSMSDYYVTDIMSVAQNIHSTEAQALASALNKAVVYFKATDDRATLTGLSVTLPYGDSEFYTSLKTIFNKCGIDTTYISWLSKFISAQGVDDFYDYDDWGNQWSGWDGYEDDYDWNEWDYYENGDNCWSAGDCGWDGSCYGGNCGNGDGSCYEGNCGNGDSSCYGGNCGDWDDGCYGGNCGDWDDGYYGEDYGDWDDGYYEEDYGDWDDGYYEEDYGDWDDGYYEGSCGD